MIKESILLYDNKSTPDLDRLFPLCFREGIIIKKIEPHQYEVPIGFLALGTPEQQEEFLLKDTKGKPFPENMMVLTGFTDQRLQMFLSRMRENKVPSIGLKAVMTEHNATWTSKALYQELMKEHLFFHKR